MRLLFKEERYVKTLVNNLIKRTVGIIEFGKAPNLRQVGTANIIRGTQRILVATAAHCVYDYRNKEYYEDIYFTAVNYGVRKYKPKAVAIPKDFVLNTYLEYDTCFLIMEEDFYKVSEFAENALDVGFNLPLELEYSLYGYPGETNKLMRTSGKAIRDIYKNSTMQGVTCDEMGGLSGGPWITEYNEHIVQNSLSVLSMNSVKNVMWGPYWGKCIEHAYCIADTGNVNAPDIELHYF